MSKYTLQSLLVIVSLTVAGNILAAMPKQNEEDKAYQEAIRASLNQKALEDAIAQSKRDGVSEAQARVQRQADALAKMKADHQRKQLANAQAKVAQQNPQASGHIHGAAAVAVVPKAINVKQAQEVIGDCSICMDNKPLMTLSCGHKLSCKECLNPMIDQAIKTKNTKQLRCPDLKCKKELEMVDVCAITNKQNADMIADIKTLEALANEQGNVVCPTPNCGMTYTNDRKGSQSINCQKCKKAFCSKCQKQHDRVKTTCEQHKASLAKAEKENEEWMKENVKPCPGCNVKIERAGGCNYMTCEKCKYNFCWLCLKKREHNNIEQALGNCNCGLWQGVNRN